MYFPAFKLGILIPGISQVAQWLKKKKKIPPGDTGLISGSGRSPGGGNGNPLQFSCLGSPMDGGTLQATVHGISKSELTK